MIRNLLPGVLLLAAGCAAQAPAVAELQGVVELDERPLGFELSGKLLDKPVVRGQLVKQGELLAALDAGLEQLTRSAREADVRAARAQLDLLRSGARKQDVKAAEAQVRGARSVEASLRETQARTRKLVAGGSSPKSQLDDLEGQFGHAEAERQAAEERLALLRAGARSQEVRAAQARLEAAQAALSLSEARLQRHSLAAPFAGAVLEVHAEPGQVLAAGAPVVTLGDIAHPYVDLFVPQGELRGVRPGLPASVRVDSEPAPFPAKVEDVGRRAEFTPRFLFSPKERPNLVVRVRLRIEDPLGRLHAGVPARAVLDRPPPREGS